MNVGRNLLTLDVAQILITTSLRLYTVVTALTVPVPPATFLVSSKVHVIVADIKIGADLASACTDSQVIEDAAFHE